MRRLPVTGRDGHTNVGDLASTTGWSPATVSLRLDGLREWGAIFFDVELDPAFLEGSAKVLLRMAVAPAHLEEAATTSTRHDEPAFVARTTGPTNLVAHVLCKDTAALYRYLTHGLASVTAIRTLETALSCGPSRRWERSRPGRRHTATV
ncbi:MULTISPECIES: Lrp/AsnC family transcriptional regulator [unclassified Streptomyces]|uniref:Lrp/AsnC family transcriptional regulator n=1 Tax=unclassified Streptomyces TaxID=2593676 RepID=UPI002E2886E0|nr:Lrp/AsnC family transcriptional regulator [Streptomyces sp. NBC_00273]